MTDEEQAREERRAKDKRDALQREADEQWVMSDARGRRWVARLIAVCGKGKRSFTQDPSGRVDAFNEGRRDVGIAIEDSVAATSTLNWELMHLEAVRDRARAIAERPTPANEPEREE